MQPETRRRLSGMGAVPLAITALALTVSLVSATVFRGPTLVAPSIHELVEALSGAAALTVMLLLLANPSIDRPIKHCLAAGFGLMGLLDLLHAVAAPGYADNWLHVVSALFGGICLASLWLSHNPRVMQGLLVTAVAGSSACALSYLLAPDKSAVLLIESLGLLLPRAFSLLAGCGFALAGAFFYVTQRPLERQASFRALALVLLAVASLSYALSTSWQLTWWWSHALRWTAYLLMIASLCIGKSLIQRPDFVNLSALPERIAARTLSVYLMSGVIMTLGLIVIVGWFFNATVVVQLHPALVPMQFNTAVGFLTTGLGLLLLAQHRLTSATVLGLLVMLLGLLTLVQYLAGLNLGLDQLLWTHHVVTNTSHPGRMAPNSALCFVLSGTAIALLGQSRLNLRLRELCGQLIGVLLGALAATALLGYLIQAKGGYGWGEYTHMAGHTAAGFLLTATCLTRLSTRLSSGASGAVPLWVPGALFLIVLIADAFTPMGIAAGVGYIPLVFCCLWYRKRSAPLVFAVLSTALIVLGYFLSQDGIAPVENSLVNRTVSVVAVWITATIVYLYFKVTEQLVITRDRLRLAIEGASLGTWDWDVSTGQVVFSERWCEMVGYRREELAQDFSTWTKLVHPDDIDAATQTVTDYIQGNRELYESIFRMQHKDGNWRWIRSLGKIFERDSEGNPLRLSGVHEDITDRLLAEQRLLLLQSAVDNSQTCVLITTADIYEPKIVYANEGTLALSGYLPEEVIGRNPSFLQQGPESTPDQSEAREAIKQALQNEQIFHGELTNFKKNGEEYQINITIFPVRDNNGTITNLGSIAYDITEQKLAKKNLEQEQLRFRAAMEHSPIGMALVAPDGSWLKVNQSLCDIVGYSQEELMASDFQTITHPDDLDLDLEHVRNVLSGKLSTYEMEKRYITKLGEVVWVLLSVSLVRHEDGSPRHFISQIQNIQARKEQEAQIKAYLEALEKSNRQLDDFAYIASHDLKEPLRGINNHSQSLLRNYASSLDERGEHKLNRLVALTGKMESLINDLLFYSRLNKNKDTSELIDTRELAREEIVLLEKYIADHNAELIVAENLPRLKHNRSRLGIIFRNLIVNGIKYNDNNRKIITISFDETFSGQEGECSNVFHIRDNGIGIGSEFHNSIFRMFKRLNSEKAYGMGTGAGLTFVNKIISQDGGKIWLDSTPGEGTTFHFYLHGEDSEKN
ncbi:PAS domain S-box protein [Gilvimarinus sp. SDUM040013]|uniref:histidine kinase n=1 Tax=Gilvimarinus gilvus TaxID=3058038 RepID=A0ABU4RUP1_9GAMM|nr:PAS domain S-box protein [Gilvimarinus sp. SDUM040013]MDO3388535.1 PAS domain S-box protein [Gilvimarinus sp. SDUM040013]MDX6848593.1 PAS domain S-box protein [Gilvimarinus sp. SDUM040013]